MLVAEKGAARAFKIICKRCLTLLNAQDILIPDAAHTKGDVMTNIKKNKMTFRATFSDFGSDMRSAYCSLETGYIAFKANNGEVFKWFSAKGCDMRMRQGQRVEITATVTENHTLQRPTFKLIPFDCFD